MIEADRRIDEQLEQLSLEQKVLLLTGRTAWRTWSLPDIGLREMVLSDGPVGVRGTGETPGEVSGCLPSPTALAACWDEAMARRTGLWLACQAREHGVDMVLTPVVNIQRTPVGGRHFECFSEDPSLTGDIASALIEGLQQGGVAACVKHFVGNEVETIRTKYLSHIGERALREVYFAPFERAVRAGVWSVMAAYNRVEAGGISSNMVSQRYLLMDILKGEWGFDGPVVSDWTAVDETVAPALGGTDLAMPGPHSGWSDGQLLAAVRRGDVPESCVDDKVRRLLVLARRVGALGGDALSVPPSDAELPRVLAAQSCVVLANKDDALPVAEPDGIRSIALIGPNACDPLLIGGGSGNVAMAHVVTWANGLAEGFPAAVVGTYPGVTSRVAPPDLDPTRDSLPGTSRPGVLVEYLDVEGHILAAEGRQAWSGVFADDIPDATATVHIATDVRLDEPGEHWLGVGTVGRHKIAVDSQVADETSEVAGDETLLDSSFNVPPTWGLTLPVSGPCQVRLEAWVQVIPTQWGPRARASLHHRLPGPGDEEMIERACMAAKRADLAIVVVGTNTETESEGWDRRDLRLPGRQDELVEAVLDVRPDAIVVVNAGAPVVLPWLGRAHTVLWCWLPGQDAGVALSDVLTGVREPAGRLPWSLPGAQGDCPVPNGVPDEHGVIEYTDGIDVGYRGWAKSGRRPARPFGFGLGWTTWDLVGCEVTGVTNDGVEIAVDVRNCGPRAGTDVIQAYLTAPTKTSPQGPDRPVLWLAGHCRVEAAAGEAVRAALVLPRRAFEVWQPAVG
ncbi:MAG: glycoside hydrolase family 3 C-terminal domain-containing protein, partial [Micrococcales bacterium]|nr:glycoside hydrolase family 3 C-terminal domain-containing protein [Micrococcales bacterium]